MDNIIKIILLFHPSLYWLHSSLMRQCLRKVFPSGTAWQELEDTCHTDIESQEQCETERPAPSDPYSPAGLHFLKV